MESKKNWTWLSDWTTPTKEYTVHKPKGALKPNWFSESLGSEVKASAWNAGDLGSIPGSGEEMAPYSSTLAWKIPWRRKWHPTSVLLPGESHGHRSLVGCSPWGHKELDATEWLHFTESPEKMCSLCGTLLFRSSALFICKWGFQVEPVFV